MVEPIRLLDSNEESLKSRVSRALTELGDQSVVVDYFTHWYTTRPPLHEAVLFRRAR
ncbi:MAG TPA: hypothetical protein VFZ89_03130 [Solirubrobacteraceae bacterium]